MALFEAISAAPKIFEWIDSTITQIHGALILFKQNKKKKEIDSAIERLKRDHDQRELEESLRNK